MGLSLDPQVLRVGTTHTKVSRHVQGRPGLRECCFAQLAYLPGMLFPSADDCPTLPGLVGKG